MKILKSLFLTVILNFAIINSINTFINKKDDYNIKYFKSCLCNKNKDLKSNEKIEIKKDKNLKINDKNKEKEIKNKKHHISEGIIKFVFIVLFPTVMFFILAFSK